MSGCSSTSKPNGWIAITFGPTMLFRWNSSTHPAARARTPVRPLSWNSLTDAMGRRILERPYNNARHASPRLDPPALHRPRPGVVRGEERAAGRHQRIAGPGLAGAAGVRAAGGVRGRRDHRAARVGPARDPPAARDRA